ncbi:hypothetical protein F5Y01DRAFT_279957 [Xylaria sp. FL0043]|nr:hypothetical protein F5Y01DRAFT_279957 [Xylaria sp. FL0043]
MIPLVFMIFQFAFLGTALRAMSSEITLYRPTDELIGENAFRVTMWVGTGVCTVLYALRIWARFVSFRRFFAEDYMTGCALAILISLTILLQLFLGDIYLILHVENHQIVPGPDFPDRFLSGLQADGVGLLLCSLGTWFIKLSFLLFFRRLGREIRSYMIFWYIAITLVIAAGATNIALIPYDCTFGNLFHTTVECAKVSKVSEIYTRYKATVSIDVISDAIIIFFPVMIVWRTKMNVRQKVILTSVFLLVGFTIAVSIVRGSIFGGVYKSVSQTNSNVLNTAWLLFWFFIEYIVSFVIACIISFRSLWTHRESKTHDRHAELQKQQRIIRARQNADGTDARPHNRLRRLYDSLLTTVADLEGSMLERNDRGAVQTQLPSDKMNVDFAVWGTDAQNSSSSEPESSHQQSSQNSTVVQSV